MKLQSGECEMQKRTPCVYLTTCNKYWRETQASRIAKVGANINASADTAEIGRLPCQCDHGIMVRVQLHLTRTVEQNISARKKTRQTIRQNTHATGVHSTLLKK